MSLMLYKIFFQNNDFASMDISEGSLTEQILYQEFIRAFGPPSQEITQEQWRRDMMIIVTNLGVNPICDGHPTITLDPKQRSLGPIAGRIIDCKITYTALTKPMMIHFLAVTDLICKFDQFGLPIFE